MSRQLSRFPNRRQVGTGKNQQQSIPNNTKRLHEEINRLNFFINAERARSSEQNVRANQLANELEEAKFQLQRQKSLKEIFINQGKGKKRELEKFEDEIDEVTLKKARLAAEVHNDIKHKKKKLLHVDYDELKAAHAADQEKFSSELQTIQQQNKTAQEELDRTRISCEELKTKYETDVRAVRQKVETLKRKRESEMKSHADKMVQGQQLIKKLRAEQDSFRQQMEQKISSLQQRSKDTEMRLNGELKQVKGLYGDLSDKYKTDVLDVRKQADSYHQDFDREVKAHAQTVIKNVDLVNKMKAQCDELEQKRLEEISLLMQASSEKEKGFQPQLEGLGAQLKWQISLTAELTAELKDREDFGPPKRKRARLEEPKQVFFPEPEPSKVTLMPTETIKSEPEPETMNVTQLSKETTDNEPQLMNVTQVSDDAAQQMSTKSPSVWKKARHFLGLRKPEKWKKKNTNEST